MNYIYPSLRIMLFALSFTYSLCQTPTENYVLSRTFRVKGASSISGNNYWGVPLQVHTQISYLDGLGKSKQTVIVSGNPLQKDLAEATSYSNMFLKEKSYLPISQTPADGKLKTVDGSYYNSGSVGSPTTNSWTQILYDTLTWFLFGLHFLLVNRIFGSTSHAICR